ncbi:hypothetical protein V6O07_18405, partial [Arthrospira platensis SPKY2]
GLLNVANFYDPLRQMVEHHIEASFIQPKYRNLLVMDGDPVTLLDRLSGHESPDGVVRWVTPDQG